MDANRYATKKTVAQGMLDIALLTSNASQLKYVLQVGPKHEFYTLLVVLISISIVLQVRIASFFSRLTGTELSDTPTTVMYFTVAEVRNTSYWFNRVYSWKNSFMGLLIYY